MACAPLQASTCTSDVKHQLLTRVLDASTSYSRAIGIAVLVVVLLAMFYAALYMWWTFKPTSKPDPSGKNKKVQSRPAHTNPGRTYVGSGPTLPGSFRGYEGAVGPGLGAPHPPGTHAQVMHSSHMQHGGSAYQRGQVVGPPPTSFGGGPPPMAMPPPPPPPPPPPTGTGFTGGQLYHHQRTPPKARSHTAAAPSVPLWGVQQRPPGKAD